MEYEYLVTAIEGGWLRPRLIHEQRELDMVDKKKFERLFKTHGFDDFRWIDPKEIVVAQWVRMKCIFGCSGYGKNACCPPNTPNIAECERFFREYKTAAIFHFEKKVDKPEDRHTWSRGINAGLLKLEQAVFLGGQVKAFLMFMDSCSICKNCVERRSDCKEPQLGRPGADAMGIDVFSTVLKAGYPIEVLSDYHQAMNRYAFLLIE
jgi:predicted metal-binding protein